MRATVTIDRVEGGFVIAGFFLDGEDMDIARTWPEACERVRRKLLLDDKFCGSDADREELRKLLGTSKPGEST